MTRSQLQPGPATDHYHLTLGVDGSPIAVFSRSVMLDDDQIKALPSEPIEVVPAPGEGRAIRWLAGYVEIDWVAAYDEPADPAYLQLFYLPPAPDVPKEASGLLAWFPSSPSLQRQGQFPMLATWNGTEGYLQTNLAASVVPLHENLPLAIHDRYNGIEDLTGGDPANTLRVTVWYGVVELDG